MKNPRIKAATYSLFLIVYAVVIVLWGAWVRISGSGDGCGTHWPLCQGSYLPAAVFERAQTAIEFLHRIKSGLFGILIFVLWFLILQAKEFSRLEKRVASAVLLFTVTEALLGAGLVLFGLVGANVSTARALTVGSHLVNTLLLIASLATLWTMLRNKEPTQSLRFKFIDYWLLFAVIVAAAVGAAASLSSTLFPVLSINEGLRQDFNGIGPWYLTVRIFHPVLAVLVLLSAIQWASSIGGNKSTLPVLMIVGTLFFGMATLVVLPRPVWMKLTHLLLADVTWVILVKAIIETRSIRIVPTRDAGII